MKLLKAIIFSAAYFVVFVEIAAGFDLSDAGFIIVWLGGTIWIFIATLTGVGGLSKIIAKTLKAKAEFTSSVFGEENTDYYAVAESEIVNGCYDKGLWSKALVEAKGDEAQRKVEYMKLRARQLKLSA